MNFLYKLIFILTTLNSSIGFAQSNLFPTRPIKVLVPVAPGGNIDTVMRIISQKMGENLGQNIIIENKPGGATNVANELVAKSTPDGYTLIANTITLVVNTSLYPKLAYDPEKDFSPVSLIASSPCLVVINPKLPIKNIRELISYAKVNSGNIRYGTSGSGGITHLSVELLAYQTGTKFEQINYKGAGPAVIALMSGEVDIGIFPIVAIAGQLSSPRLRVIGITSQSRLPLFPDIPTVNESGVPGYEFNGWVGIVAPAGTPAAIIKILNDSITRAVKSPEIIDKFNKDGAEVIASSPEQFKKLISDEVIQWSKVIKQAGIKAD
jgi:tripartite-type tricarboxylate transporter receptor subunit TctC